MAQDYTVTRAFQATDKGTGEPEVINTKGGPMHKYIFQVEEYPDWLNTLRKIDQEGKSKALNVGDTVYGDITENNYGKMQFQRQSRPDGNYGGAPAPAARPQSAAQTGGRTTDQKLDYIISLLENQFRPTQAAGTDASPTDNDERPVDLSEIDY